MRAKRTPEHNAKIAATMRTLKKTPAHRKAIGAGNRGKKRTSEQRAENHASQFAQRCSPYWWKLYRAKLASLELIASLNK